jgi:glycerate 2-kinase
LRTLCAPDKFRGTLTASEAAAALAAGFRDAGVDDVEELPLADGGEGTLDVLLAVLGGELREAEVTGPDGAAIRSSWGLLPDGTAVVELARASGLALVAGANDPVTATTRGTGELIAAAADGGATGVLVGAGGSATVDGGLGAIEALGWSLPLPVTVACDVDTLFLDAARIFGPQKGAGPAEVELLTRRLEGLAAAYRNRAGVDLTTLPGAGAAGGFAGGLAALGASLRPGFAAVAEALDFAARLESATIVVTGEGRLDETSLAGKVAVEVVRAAAERGIRAAIVAGEIADGVVERLPGRPHAVSLVQLAGSPERARRDAAALVRLAARDLVLDSTRQQRS